MKEGTDKFGIGSADVFFLSRKQFAMKIFVAVFVFLCIQAFVAEEAHAGCVGADFIHKDDYVHSVIKNGCDYDVTRVRTPLMKISRDFDDPGFNAGAIACEGIADINEKKGGESRSLYSGRIRAGETVVKSTTIPDECNVSAEGLCWMNADEPDWDAWNKCANESGKWKETKKRDNAENPRIAELKQKAGRGDVAAQYQLGLAYHKGIGVAQNAEEAAKWFRLAAEQGDAKAKRSLADVKDSSAPGKKQNSAESPYIAELRQKAESGDAEAQYKLGLARSKGIGVARDDKLAKKWLSLAAVQGHDKAKSRLAQKDNAMDEALIVAENTFVPPAASAAAVGGCAEIECIDNWHTATPADVAGIDMDAIDNKGFTPLQLAAFNGNYDVVEFYIEKGADVNYISATGLEALHLAAMVGDTDILNLLVENGANINAQDSGTAGWTPLHYAVNLQNVEAVEFLVGKGAFEKAQANDGNTPCDIGSFQGVSDSVSALIC